MQELKGTEFPDGVFKGLGYESATVTQKAYNGVSTPAEVIERRLEVAKTEIERT